MFPNVYKNANHFVPPKNTAPNEPKDMNNKAIPSINVIIKPPILVLRSQSGQQLGFSAI